MNKKRTVHDFLTVGDLDNFNDKVNRVVFNKEPIPEVKDESKEVQEIPYDPNRFESVIVDPKDIPDELLQQLADIVDKKTHFNENDFIDSNAKGPNTADKILNSVAVAYITEGSIPVAVATLIDPTKQNYKGIIPSDYYELKSGKPLENRIQQEFFAIMPEYHDKGLAQELKSLLLETSPNMFIINSTTDKETATGLAKNSYKLISRLDTEWEDEPIELWVN